jgi:hypothetical protein
MSSLIQATTISSQFTKIQKVNGQGGIRSGAENPRLAQTVDGALTVLPSKRMTRIHTHGEQKLRMRYEELGTLGSGQFGTVHKCIDVDSGKFMAIKVLTRPRWISEQGWGEELHRTLKREVETLSEINHVS